MFCPKIAKQESGKVGTWTSILCTESIAPGDSFRVTTGWQGKNWDFSWKYKYAKCLQINNTIKWGFCSCFLLFLRQKAKCHWSLFNSLKNLSLLWEHKVQSMIFFTKGLLSRLAFSWLICSLLLNVSSEQAKYACYRKCIQWSDVRKRKL